MKQELYSYAVSLKRKEQPNAPNFCIWFILGIFWLPIIMSNIIIGLIFLVSYCVLCFITYRNSDKYALLLTKIGLFLLYFGLEGLAVVTIPTADYSPDYGMVVVSITVILLSLVGYEINFFIKVKKRLYSKGRRATWDPFVTATCGFFGILAGRRLANSQSVNSDVKTLILVLICSLLIVYSITFFQKVIICKLVK